MGLFDTLPYTNFHELNLDWILETLKKLDSRLQKLEDTKSEEYKRLRSDVDTLMKWAQDFNPEIVKDIVNDYLATGVYFGLTDSGYFTAYIPQAWKDVVFKTSGFDVEVEFEKEFGHLVLIY